MRAGRLDRFITIERKAESLSDSGEPQETWSAIVQQRPASVLPVSGEERFGGDKFSALAQTEFRVRWSTELADLNPKDRVVYPARTGASPDDPVTPAIFDIVSVREIGRREGLAIIAVSRPDGAP